MRLIGTNDTHLWFDQYGLFQNRTSLLIADGLCRYVPKKRKLIP